MRHEVPCPPLEMRDDRNVPPRTELRVLFPSCFFSVRDALLTTMGGLSHLRLGPDDTATIELVLAEVLNNVVEHAVGDGNPGLIELHLRPCGDSLHCIVFDNGTQFPEGRPPTMSCPWIARPADESPEGGFGWFLIHTLSRDLSYERVEGRNRLSFCIDMGQRLNGC